MTDVVSLLARPHDVPESQHPSRFDWGVVILATFARFALFGTQNPTFYTKFKVKFKKHDIIIACFGHYVVLHF